jgi:hypothetical protein
MAIDQGPIQPLSLGDSYEAIYLLPPYDSEEQTLRHLEEMCGEIFESQLDGWYRVLSSWPVNAISTCSTAGLSTVSICCELIFAKIRWSATKSDTDMRSK